MKFLALMTKLPIMATDSEIADPKAIRFGELTVDQYLLVSGSCQTWVYQKLFPGPR